MCVGMRERVGACVCVCATSQAGRTSARRTVKQAARRVLCVCLVSCVCGCVCVRACRCISVCLLVIFFLSVSQEVRQCPSLF